jgi:hypothetical protein
MLPNYDANKEQDCQNRQIVLSVHSGNPVLMTTDQAIITLEAL